MALTSLFGSDFDLADFNSGGTPVQSYNFVLVVEGIFDMPCKSVRAFKKENEFELIQEGGLNDYVHMRRKPISKPFQFQVERYLGTDKFDIMSLGTDFILPLVLCVSRWQKPSEANSSRFYVFMGATVIEKEYSTLDSEKSGLHTETITIAYKELFAANQNFFNTDGDDIGDGVNMGDVWGFAEASKSRTDKGHLAGLSTKAAKEGNKNFHAKKPAGVNEDGNYGFGDDYSEELQSAFEERANLWTFDKGTTTKSKAANSSDAAKKGGGTASAKKSVGVNSSGTYGFGEGYTEATQKDMADKAKLWTFNKNANNKAVSTTPDAKKGKGTQSAVQPVGIKTQTGGAADAPETYGFGKDYIEASRAHLEARAHMWKFNNTVTKSKAGSSTQDAKKGSGTKSSVAPVGIKSGSEVLEGPETYGFGTGYEEALQPHYEKRAHLWKFKSGIENRAGIASKDAKKGDGKRSAAVPTGAKTVVSDDGKSVTITYGSGAGYEEPGQDTMAGKAKLWEFDPDAESRAGMSVPDAKKGKGKSSAKPASGKKEDNTEENQSDWEDNANLWKFKKGVENRAGISVADAKKGDGKASAEPAIGKGEDNAEESRADFVGKKHLWTFNAKAKSKAGLSSEDAKKGQGHTSAQHSYSGTAKEGDGSNYGFGYKYTEATQTAMEKKASLWEFDESIKDKKATSRLAGQSTETAKEGNKSRHVSSTVPDANKKLQGAWEEKAKLWPDKESAEYRDEGTDPEPSLWEFKGKAADGNGVRHISDSIPDQNKVSKADMEGKASLWKFSDKAVDGNGTKHLANTTPKQNETKKSEMESKAKLWPPKKSANYWTEGQDPEARLWPDQESAVTYQGGEEPEVRLWPDTSSAVKREGGSEPEARLWPQTSSAVKREGGSDPEARLWPGTSSAVKREGGSNPEARLWPDTASAVYQKAGSSAEDRRWPAQSSAVKKEGGQKPEVRHWPDKASATYQKKGKDPAPRRYPEVKSGQYYTKGQNPEARRWPEKKSAVYITDILS